jgi:hypothetical protein
LAHGGLHGVSSAAQQCHRWNYTCTSSIVADRTNPTPPKKTDVAIQCDLIDFQQFQKFQKFMEMMNMFKN